MASLTYGPDEPRAPGLAIVLSLFLHVGSHMLLIPLELKSGLSFLSPTSGLFKDHILSLCLGPHS